MRVSPRVLMLLAVLLAAAAAMAGASSARAPARATASATLVSGTPGRVGTLSVSGDRRRSESFSVDVEGARASSGELVVVASRAGHATAEASAAARSVSVFDGLVTAYGVRRRAEARAGKVEYTGAVNGLKVDGRMIGDVGTAERYAIGDGAGTVTVNRGSRGLVVELDRAAAEDKVGKGQIERAAADALPLCLRAELREIGLEAGLAQRRRLRDRCASARAERGKGGKGDGDHRGEQTHTLPHHAGALPQATKPR